MRINERAIHKIFDSIVGDEAIKKILSEEKPKIKIEYT